jgi:hypothetical protein
LKKATDLNRIRTVFEKNSSELIFTDDGTGKISGGGDGDGGVT